MKRNSNEFLFRGFHPDEKGDKTIAIGEKKIKGRWLLGYLWRGANQSYITPYNLGVGYDENTHRISAHAYEVITETIGASTALWDEQFQIIYQGDVVEFNDGQSRFIGLVVFECGAFGIATRETIPVEFRDSCKNDNFVSFWEIIWNQSAFDSTSVGNVTVIGNCWENPELLGA